MNSIQKKEAGFGNDTSLDTFLILVLKKMRGHITGSLMAPPKTVTNGHEGGVARAGDWVGGRQMSKMGMGSPTGPLYPRFIINHSC